MLWLRKITILFLSIFLMTNCGFTPLYGKHDMSHNHNQYLSQIDIVQHSGSSNKAQSYLEHSLYKALYHNFFDNFSHVKKKYKLHFAVSDHSQPILFFKKIDSSRKNLTVKINYEIIDIETNNVVYKNYVYNAIGYNTIDSPFTEFVTFKDAVDSVNKQNSRDILRQLNFFFNNNSTRDN